MYEISRPELLNRIGNNIIAFDYIDAAGIQKDIVRSHFKRIKEDFEDKFRSHQFRVDFTDEVVDYLVRKHAETVASFGGRAITNAIEDEVIRLLSRATLKAEYNQGRNLTFQVQVEDGALVIEEQSGVGAGLR
jgi:ATP-dependent Clp protease ATP-binding subunit ClpA